MIRQGDDYDDRAQTEPRARHDHAGGPHGHAHGSPADSKLGHGHAHGSPADSKLGHGHAHGIPLGSSERVKRALQLALILNGAFLFVEAGVGFWTGSLALLSDAAHMVSDVLALSLSLGASLLAARLTHSERTFGFVRAEALGGFVNSLLLVLTCGFIFKEAVTRLTVGHPPVAGVPVLVAGVIGLGINLGSAWALARADEDNLNVRGALLHMLADALGSVGAIVAAILVLAGWPSADAIMSLFIGLLVLAGTWGLLRDSAAVLLEFSPRGLSVAEVRQALSLVHDVREVHDLHVWSLDGRTPILSAHLVGSSEASAGALILRAEHMLKEQFGITHTTLQIEDPDHEHCRTKGCCNLVPQSISGEQPRAEQPAHAP